MKLLKIILHVLDWGLSMVPVLCHKVKIDEVPDSQQGFWKGDLFAHRRVEKCRSENWNNHTAKCFHYRTTSLHHLAIWLVESSEARIWRHQYSELVELVHPAMLFKEGHYPDHQILQYTEIDGMKNIAYNNSYRRDTFHITLDDFQGPKCSIWQILYCFLCLHLICLSHEYLLLEV